MTSEPAGPADAAVPGVAGAVLTGGASTRMGRDKAFVEVDGAAMVERALDALVAAGCAPLFVVGGDETRLRALLAARPGRAERAGSAGRTPVAVEWIADRWPGEGPLGAILTALGRTLAPTVVVATDLPALDAPTVRALLDPAVSEVDVVVASTGRPEPLCARWSPSSLPALQARFDAGERAVHRAIADLRSVEVPVDAAALRNVNRPDDL